MVLLLHNKVIYTHCYQIIPIVKFIDQICYFDLVPTPSVQATNFGFFQIFGISVIDPNPPIFENFFLPLSFAFNEDMNFTNYLLQICLLRFFIVKFFYSLIFINMKSKILLIKPNIYLIILILTSLKFFHNYFLCRKF